MYTFIVESLTHENLLKIYASNLKEVQRKIGHPYFFIIHQQKGS